MTERVNHYPNYPLIGNRYTNLDKRSKGRVIEVRSFATKNGYEIPDKYIVEVTVDEYNPSNVGHKYPVFARALQNEKRYLELTH